MYVRADFAQKANYRNSVSGSAIFCGGVLVTSLPGTQNNSTFSATEAAYVAMAEGV